MILDDKDYETTKSLMGLNIPKVPKEANNNLPNNNMLYFNVVGRPRNTNNPREQQNPPWQQNRNIFYGNFRPNRWFWGK